MLTRLISLARYALGAAWGISFFYWLRFIGDYQSARVLTTAQFWLCLAGMYIQYPLIIAVHEAGHLFSGRALGFFATQFTVLWLHLERSGTHWKWRWKKRPAKLGGLVMHFPTSRVHLRRNKMVTIAAGPAANLVTGALALLLAVCLFYAGHFARAGQVMAAAGLLFFGFTSLHMALINLVPRKLTAELFTDGGLLLRLWQQEPAITRKLAAATLIGSSYAGVRPRNWDVMLVGALQAATDDVLMNCNVALLTYTHHLDAGAPALARPQLAYCLEKLPVLPVLSQQQICCEAAYFEARFGNDAAQAEHWLNRAQDIKPFEESEGHFTQAAVAWALGQFEAARTHFQRSQQEPLLLNENDAGGRLLALDRLADLQVHLSL